MTIKMTPEHYEELTEDYIGICLHCGHEQSQCEPDARNYTCEECDLPQVFGTEQLMLEGKIEFKESSDDEA